MFATKFKEKEEEVAQVINKYFKYIWNKLLQNDKKNLILVKVIESFSAWGLKMLKNETFFVQARNASIS